MNPTAFPIPEAAFNEDAVICAKKGSGKTVLGKGIAERGLDAGERTCIIDPKGDWYGLKSSADGESAGYPIAVFGGDYADMPFSVDAAVPLARLLGSENVPAIIDTSGMTLSDRAIALNAFLRELYNVNRDSLALFLDEVHQIAPQNPHGSDAYALRETISTIVTLGRQRGFRVTSICQRVALVDKTLISQANTMIAMRLTQKHDRTPVLGWFGDNAPDDFTARTKAEIGKLSQGEAFVGDVDSDWFKRVKVGMNSTFDSSATPGRTGTRKQPKTLADVDLSGIRAALKPKPTASPSTTDEAAVDSKDVARRIAAAKKAGWDEAAAEAAHVQAARIGEAQKASYVEGYEAAINDLWPEVQQLTQSFSTALHEAAKTFGANIQPPERNVARLPVVTSKPSLKALTPVDDVQSVELTSAPAEDFSGPQRRVLDALAFWRGFGFTSPSRAQIGFVSKYSPNSSNFGKILTSLRVVGAVDYPSSGDVSLKIDWPIGRASFDEMYSSLNGPQQRVLTPLLSGKVMSRADLGEASGYSHTSSNFGKIVTSLRNIGLLDYPAVGEVAVEPWLLEIVR